MERKRVLIVEDENGARNALDVLLSEEGYEVLSAASVAEALPQLDEFDPHIVITDLMIRGALMGLELVRAVRERGDLPVIAMTAYDYASGEALGLGANSCLHKPLDVEELLATTAVLLSPES